MIALLAAMSYQGYQNLQQQKAIIGEYSNPDQEMLFDWILKETKPSSYSRCIYIRTFYNAAF